MVPGKRRSQAVIFQDELKKASLAEVTARAAADASEAAARAAADSSEATTRGNADNSLDGRLDTVEPAVSTLQSTASDHETRIHTLEIA